MYERIDTNGEEYWDSDREEADMLSASLQAQGDAHGKRMDRVERLIIDGKLGEAGRLCTHGHSGGLKGTCSQGDPRYGEDGDRCYNCGSHIDGFQGEVVGDHYCEWFGLTQSDDPRKECPNCHDLWWPHNYGEICCTVACEREKNADEMSRTS